MKTENEKENRFARLKELGLEAGEIYLRRQLRVERFLLGLQKALYGLMGVLLGVISTYVVLFRHLG